MSTRKSGHERIAASTGLGGAGGNGPDYLLALAVAAVAGLAAALAAAIQRRRGGPASAG